jgi:hypothetical protein
MKINKILIALFCLFNALSFAQCPTQGDSPKLKLQALDTLKNRTKPALVVTPISMDNVIKPGDDTKRFNSNQYVSIIAYVYDVKYGGLETCNCHGFGDIEHKDTLTRAEQKQVLDIHIEIVENLDDAGPTKRMIVEINRFTIANNKAMSYDLIHSLKGKKVIITGWLFADEEHKQNSYNTSPNGTNLWRCTDWEIHPCLSIQEIK